MQTLTERGTGLRVHLDNGVARIEIDVPEAKVNTLGVALMTDLEALLDSLAANADVRAIVIASGKPDGFVAGADIGEIEALCDREAARAAAAFGQRVFTRLETLGKPVVAAVHGVCLGGGCEMILACHHRILTDDPATRVGLPEVRLGILPGFGGTQRLPRVVGLQAALDLILTGKTLDARRALRTGLADELVYPALLHEAAVAAADRLLRAGRWQIDRRPKRALDRYSAGRKIVLRAAAKRVRRDTKGHYPAPLAVLEAVRDGLAHGGKAYDREADRLADLAMTPESRNLVGIFRLTEENKKQGADLPKPASRVRQIGLVGAGVMGGGIAQLAADRDIRVRMKDLGPEQLLAAFRTARDIFQGAVRRGRLDRRVMDAKMAHITASLDYTGFRLADVVIEAVVENLEVKKTVLRELEGQVRDECVLATNTSSLSIAEIASALHRPQRLVGMHFFNPVHRMPLVEIIRTPHTDAKAVGTVLALARQMGKTPVVVQDGPGFLVNRILAPYMNESAFLFEEGCEIETLDSMLRRFGMPMGPFELLDEVGTDVAEKVGRVLEAGLGERAQPAPLAAKLHSAGQLGKKSGHGVYRYDRPGGKKRQPDRGNWSRLRTSRAVASRDVYDTVLDRIFGLMINEAARCLDEGIIGNAGELDLALVYGIGFPPFRGGLLKYADARGLPALVQRLRDFEKSLGPRFTPAERLTRMATSGERFFLDPRNAVRG